MDINQLTGKIIGAADIRNYVQMLVTDSSRHRQKQSLDVLQGAKHWRVTDFSANKEIILAGMAWGAMPELLIKKEQDKWYFSTYSLVIAFICVGPFALPLLWFNPRFSQKTKIVVSVIVIILSYYLGILFANSIKNINSYYQLIFQ